MCEPDANHFEPLPSMISGRVNEPSLCTMRQHLSLNTLYGGQLADLLNVDRALEQILSQIQLLPPEEVVLPGTLGRVLAEDIQSQIDLPPFDSSAMDGYAVRAEDISGATPEAPVLLTIVMDIAAGYVPKESLAPGQAARIMTGACVPDGADAVVPVEDTDARWDDDSSELLAKQVNVFRAVFPGDHVRPAGSDLAVGTFVLTSGTVLRPQEIGILAALGYTTVQVSRRPRVVILSHGDELVEVDEPLTSGKIRDVNSYTIAALVETSGAEPVRLPIARDTLDELRHLFKTALAHQPDMIISSAGVSVGATDLIRTVLKELGTVNLWRVNLRPGKPFAFGQLQDVPFFGLPGNPVSAMVTFDLFVRPSLLKQAGHIAEWPSAMAVVGEAMQSDGRRSYLRVKLDRIDDQLIATSVGSQSSSALISMVLADGLLIVPENMTNIPVGISLPVRLLR
jgi:molybdopterin molybdotransferase